LAAQEAEPDPLLNRFTIGDPAAFETLFRQFQHEVRRWVLRIVRQPSAADDVTIEAFWRIYRSHARFDPRRSFGAWARRIATNAAIDYLKSSLKSGRPEVELPPQLADSAAKPADPELRRAIREAFGQLPAGLRAASSLALVEERSHQEIAEALGISEGAVKSRVFRATRLLRKKLRNWGREL
jgi:RNA polymerase sigma-70 factor, ECF subfamily